MITLRVDQRAKNIEKISRFKKRMEDELNKRYRKRVLAIFKDLLNVSPQYSGDFTSNWHLLPDTGSPAGYKEWRNKNKVVAGRKNTIMGLSSYEEALYAGHSEAINFAFTRAKFVQYNYLQKVYFVNSTELEFTATTVSDNEETHALRPVNLMSPPQQMFSYLRSKYPSRQS